MLSPEDKERIRLKLDQKINATILAIEELRELTKPISPENAIGRISRMDAINNKSVNEAALRNAQSKLQSMEKALSELKKEQFGKCRQCGSDIELEKLLVLPESFRCVTCVKASR